MALVGIKKVGKKCGMSNFLLNHSKRLEKIETSNLPFERLQVGIEYEFFELLRIVVHDLPEGGEGTLPGIPCLTSKNDTNVRPSCQIATLRKNW